MTGQEEKAWRFRRGQFVTLATVAVKDLPWAVATRMVWGAMSVSLLCFDGMGRRDVEIGEMAVQFVAWLRGDRDVPGWLPKGFGVKVSNTI